MFTIGDNKCGTSNVYINWLLLSILTLVIVITNDIVIVQQKLKVALTVFYVK